MIPKLTKEQAAIIGAYTGVIAGPFIDIQEYAEKALGRPIWTHEFASEAVAEELKEAAKADFLAICHEWPPITADLPNWALREAHRLYADAQQKHNVADIARALTSVAKAERERAAGIAVQHTIPGHTVGASLPQAIAAAIIADDGGRDGAKDLPEKGDKKDV